MKKQTNRAKHHPIKSHPWYFILGFLFVLLTPVALLLAAASIPVLFQKILGGITIGIFILVKILAYSSPEFNNAYEKKLIEFTHSQKTMSFMHGLGISFLSIIILFFGAMIWGVMQA